jgi:hypothetical protein
MLPNESVSEVLCVRILHHQPAVPDACPSPFPLNDNWSVFIFISKKKAITLGFVSFCLLLLRSVLQKVNSFSCQLCTTTSDIRYFLVGISIPKKHSP